MVHSVPPKKDQPGVFVFRRCGRPGAYACGTEKSIALTRACPDHVVRLRPRALRNDTGEAYWPSPARAGEAARMAAEAFGEMVMSFGLAGTPKQPVDLERLDKVLPCVPTRAISCPRRNL